jgi:hypothetical protein
MNWIQSMAERTKAPLEKVFEIYRMGKAMEAEVAATRRSSPEEIEKIEDGIGRIFENDHDTEMTTKEMAKEIGVPFKQGNLTRISRKAKQLRLTYQTSKQAAE